MRKVQPNLTGNKLSLVLPTWATTTNSPFRRCSSHNSKVTVTLRFRTARLRQLHHTMALHTLAHHGNQRTHHMCPSPPPGRRYNRRWRMAWRHLMAPACSLAIRHFTTACPPPASPPPSPDTPFPPCQAKTLATPCTSRLRLCNTPPFLSHHLMLLHMA